MAGEEDMVGEADPWNTGARRRPQRHALWVFGVCLHSQCSGFLCTVKT